MPHRDEIQKPGEGIIIIKGQYLNSNYQLSQGQRGINNHSIVLQICNWNLEKVRETSDRNQNSTQKQQKGSSTKVKYYKSAYIWIRLYSHNAEVKKLKFVSLSYWTNIAKSIMYTFIFFPCDSLLLYPLASTASSGTSFFFGIRRCLTLSSSVKLILVIASFNVTFVWLHDNDGGCSDRNVLYDAILCNGI